MDETLKRTLDILYDDWFRYDDLCPRAMWLIDLPYDQPGYFLNLERWPRSVYFLQHIGMQKKSPLDWRRFYLMQWGHAWHTGAEFPRRDAPLPDVFDVGLASFAVNPESGNLVLDITFVPKYGRGYELASDGTLGRTWVS